MRRVAVWVTIAFGLLPSGSACAEDDITLPIDTVVGVPDDGDWPAGERPDLAIDDRVSTKYLHFKGDFYPDAGPTGLRITPAAGPTLVTGLTFTTANDCPGRDPVAFELSGSNYAIDGPYTLIAAGDIVDFNKMLPWPRLTTNLTPITFHNEAVYKHYQLLFTAIRGPVGGCVNSMQIAEVELLGHPDMLAQAHAPRPVDGAVGVSPPLVLEWEAGTSARWHDVYLGTEPALRQADLVASRLAYPMYVYSQSLEPGVTYYWRVDEIDTSGMTVVTGDVWSFTVKSVTACNPEPVDGDREVSPTPVLKWSSGQDAVEHHVFLADRFADVCERMPQADRGFCAETRLDAGPLRASTTYYWCVDEITEDGTVHAGDIWTFATEAGLSGVVLREWWLNLPGTDVGALKSDPRYPNRPDSDELMDLFEGPVNWSNNYGSRLYGWLAAPEPGQYTFWIASDDCSELWLSTDEDPANRQLIACVNGWTNARQWTKFPSQRSQPITLEAGRKYYIEALMKEGGGGDNIAVAWQPPGGVQQVIPAQYVDTFAFLPLRAFSPSPPDGAESAEPTVVLGWLGGENAEQHRVFLGEDEAAVAGADTSTAGVYCGQQTGTTYSPEGLEWGKTYYWRVDEVNDLHPESPWRGEVWRFSLPSGPPGYLLITNEELAHAFQVLVDWRTAEGLAGSLITVEDICGRYEGKDQQEQIRNCIKDYYENHNVVYVTLGGDDAVVPVRYCFVCDCNTMPTDLYYGGLDGTWDADGDGVYGEAGEDDADLYPEVWVGRIPVRTAEEAAGYVNKVITYETASPDGFSNTMLLAGDTHTALRSGTGRPAGYLDHDPVGGDEVAVVNLYREQIQPYWQATPADKLIDTKTSWDTIVCGDYDFTPEHLGERLNWGYHHVYIRTHGNAGHCGSENGKFFTTDAMALTNADRPSIVYCEGCTTGAFDLGEPSLSEAFLRNPDGGAVVFIGCSRVNFFGCADASYRELFLNKRQRIGEAFGYYKMSWAAGSTTNRWTRWVQFGRNLQGDSALRLLREETARDLHLASPHGCEIIEVGSDLTVRWNASGTDFDAEERIRLEYSGDSGKTWLLIPGADALPYNQSMFAWEDSPLPAGSHYRVRVTALADPSVSDTSARDFTIGELCLLTVRSVPDANVVIEGSYDGVTHHPLGTDYNITILKGTVVNVVAPSWVPEDTPELVFVQWTDEAGDTLTTALDYTFAPSRNMTIVAEYAEPILWHYYVNDDIPENGVAAGDDGNDGRSPERPMRHIQALLDKYPRLGKSSVIHVSAGVYEENLSLSADNTGLELAGAGQDLTIIDGGQKGSCILLSSFTEGLISGITIRNGSNSHGGGIWCAYSSLRIQDCTFLENSASEGAGAILIDSPSSVEILQCTFTRNSSGIGGAIDIYGDSKVSFGSAEITSCLFEANTAVHWGGAIRVQSLKKMTQIHDCAFVGNTSSNQGGAIHLDRSVLPEVVQCTFRGNSSMFGGALFNYGGTAQIKSCLFEANHADRDGGAVCNLHDCLPTFTNCIFSSNDAGRYGGAMTTLADQSHAAVTNCTFSGNRAGNPGGALCAQGSLGATATNCIFWGSRPDQVAGGVVIGYCDIQGGWPGQGNINSDPLFANPESGDFHLKSQRGRWDPVSSDWIVDNVTSPCIDAGDPDMSVGDEPEPNGGRINMGAYGGTVEASKSP